MTGRTPAALSNDRPDHEMLVELVCLHAQAMRRMPWVQTVLVLGIGVAFHQFVGPLLLWSWATLSVCMEIGRARYSVLVLRRAESLDPKPAHAVFVALAAASGAVIGLGAVLFIPRMPLLPQALMGIILFATPAAGVAVSQSSRYIVMAYALSILVPASVTWSVLHRSQAVGGMGMTILYCAVIALAAADGEKLLLRSVKIRHERDRLVRDLEQRNEDVHAAVALAEQSAQARARVLAAASHDLRQPLHALSVYSAVLASKPAPALLNEVSGNIDQIVRSLGNLLNGLLDLSRLSAGYYVPEHQEIGLERLIAGVCDEFRHPAHQKSLALIQELEPVRVLGDPVALARIARNLVDNAIKYTESGSVRITLRTERSEGLLCAALTVTDTGRGIPTAEHSRIFEEFYQIGNPGRDRSRGVGLGLAIVQRLCELIGSTITVKSVVGEGTSFRVELPALPSSTESSAAAVIEPKDVPLRAQRIYVVDDEVDILKSMRALLGLWGIEVFTAGSAVAAEELFEQRGAPDLMIVDLRLGEGEHGAQLTDRLRLIYGFFPVLIITGETASEALRQANAAGCTLLQKPIAAELLRQAIATTMAG
jgi:signal transduction histidine kinase